MTNTEPNDPRRLLASPTSAAGRGPAPAPPAPAPVRAGEGLPTFARVVSRLQLTETALAGMLAIHDSVTQGQERELREKWIPLARMVCANASVGLSGQPEATEAAALLARCAALEEALERQRLGLLHLRSHVANGEPLAMCEALMDAARAALGNGGAA